MATELRKMGIDIVGDMPWGAHFCHFYHTKADLLDILIPYFKAGLENDEYCIWVVFHPLTEKEARNALAQAMPEFDRYSADVEIVRHSQGYFKASSFDLQKVINGWKEKLHQALSRGYAGLRVNGNEAWLTEKDWNNFSAYEKELNELMVNQRMIVLCTYPLAMIGANEFFDVARSHQLIVAKRDGKWEVIETAELKQAKAELKKMNEELEQRVVEKTKALRESNATIRAMAARLAETVEDERRGLSRELHDRIGQHLVALTLNLKAITNSLTAESEARVRRHLRDSAELIEEATGFIRDLMSELRPPDLDDYGLAAALRWYADRFSQRIGVPISVKSDPRAPRLEPLVEISLFRIAQEALTNIARHASADRADIALEILPGAARLTVKDNGVGFDPAILQEPGGTRGWGLITMRERAEAMGGELRVESVPGKGARVVVELKRGSRGYTGISR